MKTRNIFLSLTWSLQSIAVWTCPNPALLAAANPLLPGFPPDSLALIKFLDVSSSQCLFSVLAPLSL